MDELADAVCVSAERSHDANCSVVFVLKGDPFELCDNTPCFDLVQSAIPWASHRSTNHHPPHGRPVGLDAAQAQVQSFSVTDARAERYGGENRSGSRFIISQTLVVRSKEPQKVLTASAKIGDLVAAGVVLTSGGEYGQGVPTFLFTGLNALKPEMIAEATARAREAAEKFAHDSGSRLGRIRHANQGVFEIHPRDRAPGITEEGQVEKTVRVVSTLEYALED